MSYRILDQQQVTPLRLVAPPKVYMIDDPAGTPVFVDDTTDFADASATDVLVWPATEAEGDQLAIGDDDATFRRLRLKIGTAGVGGTMAVKYWDGAAWTAVPNLTDGTTDLTEGTSTYELTWDTPDDWEKLELNDDGVERYYIVLEVATVYATNPVLDQGWIVRSNPIEIPARDERVTQGGVLVFSCVNPDSTLAFFSEAGWDNATGEPIPASMARPFTSLEMSWGAMLASPPELYSTETAPDAVFVTIYGNGA